MDNMYYTFENCEQYAFFRIPKMLIINPVFKELNSDAKLLYGLMLDRMSLSQENKWADEQGRVFIAYSIKAIMDDLGCGNQKASTLIKSLLTIGLIEQKRQGGVGNCAYYYIKNFMEVAKELEAQNVKTTSPKCENHTTENVKITSRKCENHMSENVKITSPKCENHIPKVWKSHTNKTKYNKTKYNKTDMNKTDIDNDIESVTDTFDLKAIVDTYHRLCPTLPKVDLSDQSFNAHWSGIIKVTCLQLKHEGKYPEDSTELDIMADIFIKVGQSDYLTGRTGKWTGCTFHWIITAIHASDIASGRYDTYRRPKEGGTTYGNETGAAGTTSAEFSSTDFTNSALERFRQIKAQQSAV